MSQALSRESPRDKHHAIIFPWLSPQQLHPTAGLAASPPALFASSWLQMLSLEGEVSTVPLSLFHLNLNHYFCFSRLIVF